MREWWINRHVLPPSATRAPDGMLTIGGVRMDEIARTYGTAAQVVDEGALRGAARAYVEALAARRPGGHVAFASKSFPCTAVYRTLAAAGLWIDVSSTGELAIALAAGVEPSTVIVHGNARADVDLAAALQAGVGYIVVDGRDDVERLARLAPSLAGDRIQPLLVRVIPEVVPDTHPAISTGGSDAKFGVPFGQLRAILDDLAGNPHVRVDGLHLHIGSQILDVAAFGDAVATLATRLADLAIPPFPVYDLGGGLGVAYTRDDEAPDVGAYLDVLLGAVERHLPAAATIIIEPGRSLVARAGVSLYTVATVKRHERVFVAIDGGMGDNLEVSLYGQRFEALIAARAGGATDERCDIVGRHCESGDRLVADALLPAPAVGDLIVIPATGAYTYAMANNYNASLRPPVVFVDGGAHRAVVRRETIDDLLARDLTS